MARDDRNPFPTRGIHRYVARYIRGLPELAGRTVLDIPCGDGRATWEFRKKGARVVSLDLFPGLMKLEDAEAAYADLMEPLPLEDASVDCVISQEGIEHIPDQLGVLREFNRVLKKGGTLFLTTPNYSHARARLFRFLIENDHWKRMPPTEIDGVWFAEEASDKLYFGHLFLLPVQHLASLATLAGFRVAERVRTDPGNTSIVLGVLLYPLFALFSLLSYFSYRKKNVHVPREERRRILWERVRLNLSPTTLFYKHSFWVLTKEHELDEVARRLKAMRRVEG